MLCHAHTRFKLILLFFPNCARSPGLTPDDGAGECPVVRLSPPEVNALAAQGI